MRQGATCGSPFKQIEEEKHILRHATFLITTDVRIWRTALTFHLKTINGNNNQQLTKQEATMCVKVKFLGRLGNNLFQYAIGRIIAEHHGLELECEQIEVQKEKMFMGHKYDIGPIATLETLTRHFPGAPLRIPGRRVDTPVECFETGQDNNWSGQTIDFQSILANRTPRQIRLAGFFQRYEYFAPYRDRIRRWFRCTPTRMPFEVAANDVIVSIRRGFDYGVLNWTLSLSYYEQVLSGLRDIGQVYVCGTGIDDQVRRLLGKYNPIYHNGTPIEQFYFMTQFKRIVLSNSTFAWWASFLSDAEEVYAPRAAHINSFGFTGFEDVDLHMREPRYHEVSNTSVARYGFLVPNNDVVAWIDNISCELVIQGSEGISTRIGVDDTNRNLLAWLIQQKEPVELDEVRDRYLGNDLDNLIVPILTSGLMSPKAEYADADRN
jgi:Glycosyl transferase family 11